MIWQNIASQSGQQRTGLASNVHMVNGDGLKWPEKETLAALSLHFRNAVSVLSMWTVSAHCPADKVAFYSFSLCLPISVFSLMLISATSAAVYCFLVTRQ